MDLEQFEKEQEKKAATRVGYSHTQGSSSTCYNHNRSGDRVSCNELQEHYMQYGFAGLDLEDFHDV
jgi:hypothetical protein